MLHPQIRLFTGLLLLAATVCCLPARGQAPRSGGGASAELVQQLQELASARTSLQAQVAKLQGDLDAMRKERDTLKNAQQALDRRTRAAEGQLRSAEEVAASRRESQEKEVAQLKDQLQQLIAKFRETIQVLRTTESDAATTKQTLAVREQALKVCADRNVSLYKLNREVLEHYEHDSAWSHLTRAEPFTRIKRVQLENLIDGYAQRAADQQVPSTDAKSDNLPPSGSKVPASNRAK
jgi:prefoldin subunit 5